MPHPLVNDVHVQVQTYSQRSHPVKVFLTAIEDLSIETDSLQKQFAVSSTCLHFIRYCITDIFIFRLRRMNMRIGKEFNF